MVIGLLLVEIHFPQARSLKDKRRELAGLKSRIKGKFNAAVAEIDFQDMWQRTAVGIATLSRQQAVVEQTLESILRDIYGHVEGEVLGSETRFY
jgi:uncharacterized protein YlxP (DUF503 family)